MILPLLLGVDDPGQPGEEPLPGVDHDEAHPEVLLEGRPEQLGLLLAHEPVVDVDAGQPVADGAMDERGRDRRVDAAAQGADDEAVRADLAGVGIDPGPDLGDGRLDEVRRRPGRPRAGDPDDEVAQDVAAARRVDDLGVELDAVEAARPGRPGRRTASKSVWAVERKPSGSRVIESPWLIQTGWSRSSPANRPSSTVNVTVAGPYSRLAAGRTSPPSSRAMSWAP